ncbi:type II toxin-antitoxin system VapC family toxin [Arcicella sp. DC2W]|uniref:Ribonuclease VapC n=1 Tax=Arcicella gelida TaxID=2984195 RepID=A0ABU5S1U4_9BACT|nr:type II toxin-antitoxin system VapC family toxin [Arcicella sp. DC2W]MEA5402407.1 type II toxin-antitoxin system VapC family toxin [Arcicella sp. DC2W]
MSGNKILLDTNIALYLFKGDEDLGYILQDTEAYVSFINELELLGHKAITPQEENWIALFLEECTVLDFNQGIKDITIKLRRKYSLKLPDAIVAATAIFLGVPLISADRHFDKVEELTFILYKPTEM